jgi:diadenosine tetraphosphate (Ap4A) HIT family hydrolase
MGQICPSHILIVSHRHYNAIGQMPEEEREGLKRIISGVEANLPNLFIKDENKDEYGILFFEHGVFDDSGDNGGCGISHLHIHALCYKKKYFQALKNHLEAEHGNNMKQTDDVFAEIAKLTKEKKTYILLMFGNFKYIITASDNKFESQYMRRKAAAQLENVEWNWKKVDNEYEKLKGCYDILLSSKNSFEKSNP